MCDVLEHCFSPENALIECKRILKNHGRLIVEVPFENEFGKNLLQGHSSIFKDEETFEDLLSNCGLSILKKNLIDDEHNWYLLTVIS